VSLPRSATVSRLPTLPSDTVVDAGQLSFMDTNPGALGSVRGPSAPMCSSRNEIRSAPSSMSSMVKNHCPPSEISSYSEMTFSCTSSVSARNSRLNWYSALASKRIRVLSATVT
jgi:hypothetical protein